MVFLAANVAAGGAMILVARLFEIEWLSLYLLVDDSLLVLVSLQALVFEWWRHLPLGGHTDASR